MRRDLKLDSKKILRHQIGKALAIFFMLAAVVIFFALVESLCTMLLGGWGFADVFALHKIQYTPEIFAGAGAVIGIALLRLFVVSPLWLSQQSWYFRMAVRPETPIWELFRYFSGLRQLFRAVRYTLSLTIRTLFYGILFIGPPVGLLWAGYYFYISTDDTLVTAVGAVTMTISALLVLLAVVLLIVFCKRYFLVKYIMAEHEELPVRRCFALSCQLMQGRRWEIFFLGLSFWPWILASVLIIPILYYFPHHMTTAALYAHCYLADVDLADVWDERKRGKRTPQEPYRAKRMRGQTEPEQEA